MDVLSLPKRGDGKRVLCSVPFYCIEDVLWLLEIINLSIFKCQKCRLVCWTVHWKVCLASLMLLDGVVGSRMTLWRVLTAFAQSWFHHLCPQGRGYACFVEASRAVETA